MLGKFAIVLKVQFLKAAPTDLTKEVWHMQQLSEQQLKPICNILADTSRGLTKGEIKNTLHNCGIDEVDDGSRTINGGMFYQIGLNKRDWLYNCFVADINKHHSCSNVFKFIESALSPISYTLEEKCGKYSWMLEEINKVLILLGMEVGNDGKLKSTIKADTLDEVDRRVNKLKRKLYERAIHADVTKYCVKDYLQKDYFDAVLRQQKVWQNVCDKLPDLLLMAANYFKRPFLQKIRLSFLTH